MSHADPPRLLVVKYEDTLVLLATGKGFKSYSKAAIELIVSHGVKGCQRVSGYIHENEQVVNNLFILLIRYCMNCRVAINGWAQLDETTSSRFGLNGEYRPYHGHEHARPQSPSHDVGFRGYIMRCARSAWPYELLLCVVVMNVTGDNTTSRGPAGFMLERRHEEV